MFAPFEQDSEMIGPPEHSGMINFRVDDLDAIVNQLRAAAETVEVDPERYPNGRFAELRDPEGNAIQLWQPMDPELQRDRGAVTRAKRSGSTSSRRWVWGWPPRTLPAPREALSNSRRTRGGPSSEISRIMSPP